MKHLLFNTQVEGLNPHLLIQRKSGSTGICPIPMGWTG